LKQGTLNFGQVAQNTMSKGIYHKTLQLGMESKKIYSNIILPTYDKMFKLYAESTTTTVILAERQEEMEVKETERLDRKRCCEDTEEEDQMARNKRCKDDRSHQKSKISTFVNTTVKLLHERNTLLPNKLFEEYENLISIISCTVSPKVC
jgi:hypothetical protein